MPVDQPVALAYVPVSLLPEGLLDASGVSRPGSSADVCPAVATLESYARPTVRGPRPISDRVRTVSPMRRKPLDATIDDLFAAMERVAADVAALRDQLTSPRDIAVLARVAQTIESVLALKSAPHLIEPRQLTVSLFDARHLSDILQSVSQPASRLAALDVAALLSDRIMEAVGYITHVPAGTPTTDEPQVKQTLQQLAAAYGNDAERERKTARTLYLAALGLLLASVGLGVFAVRDSVRRDGLQFSRLGAYALVSVVMIAAAALALHQASSKRRRSEEEARRLQRQLQGLDPYLSSMPETLRDLCRGTLVPSLFSRLPGEEPWREPRWPTPDSVLEAVRTSTAVNASRRSRPWTVLRRRPMGSERDTD